MATDQIFFRPPNIPNTASDAEVAVKALLNTGKFPDFGSALGTFLSSRNTDYDFNSKLNKDIQAILERQEKLLPDILLSDPAFAKDYFANLQTAATSPEERAKFQQWLYTQHGITPSAAKTLDVSATEMQNRDTHNKTVAEINKENAYGRYYGTQADKTAWELQINQNDRRALEQAIAENRVLEFLQSRPDLYSPQLEAAARTKAQDLANKKAEIETNAAIKQNELDQYAPQIFSDLLVEPNGDETTSHLGRTVLQLWGNQREDEAVSLLRNAQPENFSKYSDSEIKAFIKKQADANVNQGELALADAAKAAMGTIASAGSDYYYNTGNFGGASPRIMLSSEHDPVKAALAPYKDTADPTKFNDVVTILNGKIAKVIEKSKLQNTEENRRLAAQAIMNSIDSKDNTLLPRIFTGKDKVTSDINVDIDDAATRLKNMSNAWQGHQDAPRIAYGSGGLLTKESLERVVGTARADVANNKGRYADRLNIRAQEAFYKAIEGKKISQEDKEALFKAFMEALSGKTPQFMSRNLPRQKKKPPELSALEKARQYSADPTLTENEKQIADEDVRIEEQRELEKNMQNGEYIIKQQNKVKNAKSIKDLDEVFNDLDKVKDFQANTSTMLGNGIVMQMPYSPYSSFISSAIRQTITEIRKYEQISKRTSYEETQLKFLREKLKYLNNKIK